MGIVDEYLEYTKKWKKEYGEKTIVLMQVGSFFEVYALKNKSAAFEVVYVFLSLSRWVKMSSCLK